MKQLFKLFKGGAIAAMALMISACSSNDLEETALQPNNKAEGIPFTATIRVGESATTRALIEDGATIVPSWAEGDKVALIHGSINDEMTVSSVSDGVATITGNITGSPADGDAVTIIYPSSAADGATGNVKADLLTNQDGTLATIAKNYDVRKGTGTLNVGTTATLRGNVSLENQYAIVKFITKNYDGSADINVSPLTITIGTQLYTITPASATNVLYAALPAVSSQTVSFSGTVGSMPYLYSKAGVSFDAGKYYQSTLKMLPEGAIPGKFTVNSSGKKVYFSQGNLQATTSDSGANWTWAFAINQWDIVGNGSVANISINGNGTISGTGTVDLFAWSTPATYYGIHNSTNDADYNGDFRDWGTLAINNGGNTADNGWRTLTNDEWYYLLSIRKVTVNSEAKYPFGRGNVEGKKGFIILPDNWDGSVHDGFVYGNVIGWSNVYSSTSTPTWAQMEAAGCVFLPLAGLGLPASYASYYSGDAIYWSSTLNSEIKSYGWGFSEYLFSQQEAYDRYIGNSVRLVRDAE